MTADIVTMGEVLVDLTQISAPNAEQLLFAALPGGAPANVAVAASRLGAHTSFIGKVGRDGFGAFLRRTLAENGVDTSGMLTCDAMTTLAIVTIDAEGERSFEFARGADATLEPREIPRDIATNAKIFHFGSVGLAAEPIRSATLAALDMARESSLLISYDPNYREALWSNVDEARRWMRNPVPIVDIIKISEDEIEPLTGTNSPADAALALAEAGVQLVFVTLGAEGALFHWQGETRVVPGVKLSVKDTNGAGDTFTGAVLSRLSSRPKGPFIDLDAEELADIVAFANRAAAFTCSGSGAITAMPSLIDLG